MWISEPLFVENAMTYFGSLSVVRRAAFAAIVRSVECGTLETVSESFFYPIMQTTLNGT